MKIDKEKIEALKRDVFLTRINDVMMLLQAILWLFILVFALASFYTTEVLNVALILLSIFFVVLAYNNYRVYKRKGLTCLYIITGICILIWVLGGYYG